MMEKINQIVIIENGAYSIKVGLFTDENPKLIPNCITKVKNEKRRPFIGDQMEECKDYSGMYYILPFSRGYLLNWDVQRQIWDHVFRTVLKLQSDKKNHFSNTGIIITEPVYNFEQIRKSMIQVLFDEYGFGKILITSAPQLAMINYLFQENKKDSQFKEFACLVVDSGYSFTHIVPFVEGHKITTHLKRIDIGGKALTNYLKEIISYRQINVLDETYVVNQMKEDCCYVSLSLWKDLELAKNHHRDNPILQDYVLPDYTVYKRGFVYDKQKNIDLATSDYQLIKMNNERFQVPETLFHPSDVNIDQIGISETIVYAVSEFNPNYKLKNHANGADLLVQVQSGRERPENLKDIESDEEDEEYYEEEKNQDENGEENNKSPSNNTNPEDDQSSSENKKMVDFSIYDDENIQAHLYNNILLIGGNCCFPNFKDRVNQDLRSNVPDMLNVKVHLPKDPITFAWQGARLICLINEKLQSVADQKDSLFHKYAVSRKEYRDFGVNHCNQKFFNHQLPDNKFFKM